MKTVWAGVLLLGMVSLGILNPSHAQDSVTVPVDVTITVPEPPPPPMAPESVVIPTTSINVVTSAEPTVVSPPSGFVAGFSAEICGGIGNPLQDGIRRFADLTEERQRTSTRTEQERLDRDILAEGLKLPDLVVEEITSRGLTRGQTADCDDLLDGITQLMTEVADYLGALQNARSSVLW